MIMHFTKLKNDENGFWAVFVIILVLTLVLLGMGGHVLMRSEGASMVQYVNAVQADYAANAGAYHGIKRLQFGALDESTPLQVGGGTVVLDTSLITGSNDILLVIQATAENAQRIIEIELSNAGKLEDKAVYTTGDVFNVAGRDSLGNTDPTRVVTLADSIPSIREDSLSAMSLSQGFTDSSASYTAPTDYPATSFYQPDGVTPNVVHVMGDLIVNGGVDIYGIWVVEGDVTLHGSSRIYGVIYLPNPTSTIITGGGNPTQSTINGGIISHGNITGTGNHISVKHWPEFMRVFCGFLTYDDELDFDIISWNYL